jgi:hypothetical protein
MDCKCGAAVNQIESLEISHSIVAAYTLCNDDDMIGRTPGYGESITKLANLGEILRTSQGYGVVVVLFIVCTS